MRFKNISYGKIITYLSFPFVILFLLQNDYLKIESFKLPVENYFYLIISVIILFLSFFAEAYCFIPVTAILNKKIEYRKMMRALCRTMLTKYVPGKILLFYSLGYYLHKLGLTKKQAAITLLYCQLLSILTALILGMNFIMTGSFSPWFKINSILLILAISILFLSKQCRKVIDSLYLKIFKKKNDIAAIESKKMIKPLFSFFVLWLTNGVAFYFFISSFSHEIYPAAVILIFPIARVIGSVAVITPGGMGVREGIITMLLANYGVGFEFATVITIYSRIWILSVESILFLYAKRLDYSDKKDTEQL